MSVPLDGEYEAAAAGPDSVDTYRDNDWTYGKREAEELEPFVKLGDIPWIATHSMQGGGRSSLSLNSIYILPSHPHQPVSPLNHHASCFSHHRGGPYRQVHPSSIHCNKRDTIWRLRPSRLRLRLPPPYHRSPCFAAVHTRQCQIQRTNKSESLRDMREKASRKKRKRDVRRRRKGQNEATHGQAPKPLNDAIAELPLEVVGIIVRHVIDNVVRNARPGSDLYFWYTFCKRLASGRVAWKSAPRRLLQLETAIELANGYFDRRTGQNITRLACLMPLLSPPRRRELLEWMIHQDNHPYFVLDLYPELRDIFRCMLPLLGKQELSRVIEHLCSTSSTYLLVSSDDVVKSLDEDQRRKVFAAARAYLNSGTKVDRLHLHGLLLLRHLDQWNPQDCKFLVATISSGLNKGESTLDRRLADTLARLDLNDVKTVERLLEFSPSVRDQVRKRVRNFQVHTKLANTRTSQMASVISRLLSTGLKWHDGNFQSFVFEAILERIQCLLPRTQAEVIECLRRVHIGEQLMDAIVDQQEWLNSLSSDQVSKLFDGPIRWSYPTKVAPYFRRLTLYRREAILDSMLSHLSSSIRYAYSYDITDFLAAIYPDLEEQEQTRTIIVIRNILHRDKWLYGQLVFYVFDRESQLSDLFDAFKDFCREVPSASDIDRLLRKLGELLRVLGKEELRSFVKLMEELEKIRPLRTPYLGYFIQGLKQAVHRPI